MLAEGLSVSQRLGAPIEEGQQGACNFPSVCSRHKAGASKASLHLHACFELAMPEG